jgi:hypothetical protein
MNNITGIEYNPPIVSETGEITANNSKVYDKISQIHFCPICNNLMKFIQDNGTNNTTTQNWFCTVCNYKEKFTANIFVITKSNQTKPIDYSLYKFDQSLKRCYNNCPNCNNIRELCIFYYENDSMKNGYVCTTCGKFFTN